MQAPHGNKLKPVIGLRWLTRPMLRNPSGLLFSLQKILPTDQTCRARKVGSLINAGDYDGDSNNDFLILNITTSIVASVLLQNNSVLSVVGLINLNFAPDFTLLSSKL